MKRNANSHYIEMIIIVNALTIYICMMMIIKIWCGIAINKIPHDITNSNLKMIFFNISSIQY